ncbi:Uncharacterised protein [Salmonella enterica subsp. enterica serovar Bovismorbificans]|uniref:Uncharacterized protein n=1 Tax=Salmonella enterica subsp. enterica serovar Bovismorbificans TaxID=58097 RepID=A0A655DK93_SALET|nr:Uncharacterised protein [Salmonella enterica subsp. enterica serovar Bovismorbificans]CNT81720.1 Uncharacterised protein [Salmonella enterica subsp. enterica serovar Bovismorbificans]CNU72223.1 Uncharacterised protein [Salmonella enterica subsp. enterica serovar Bovismorbificans]CPR48176.1 Uncharacterised protein [Salmonella enterica subsp. enterica serovar Bovismorbificans]CQB61920.1 Uncharacterised protein [Salmonella enterica subsp. enterica serovar Bovismorbificans]
MLNTPAFKPDIGVHDVPFVGFKAIVRQHFIRRLNILLAFALFRPFRLLSVFPGIHANQRAKIGQA